MFEFLKNFTIYEESTFFALMFFFSWGFSALLLCAELFFNIKHAASLGLVSAIGLFSMVFSYYFVYAPKNNDNYTFYKNQKNISIKFIYRNDQENPVFLVSKVGEIKKATIDFKPVGNSGISKQVTKTMEMLNENLFYVSCDQHSLSFRECFSNIEKNYDQILITQNDPESDMIVLNK